MGFTGALRAQFDHVVIALHKRDQAHQLQKLAAPPEGFRIEPDALHQDVDPLICGEGRTCGLKPLKVDLGNLDRLDGLQDPGRDPSVLREFILHIGDRPHTRDQELWMCLHRATVDGDLFDPKVLKSRLVAVCLFVQRNTDHVDDLVSALFLDGGLNEPRFAAMHVMFAQDVLDRLDTGLDRCFVICRAVLAQQIFQNICGHDRVALHGLYQVLADHKSREMFIDLGVEVAHGLDP